jgi:hypothetical protein
LDANSVGGWWWVWRWQSYRFGFGGSCHGGDGEVMWWSSCFGGEEVGSGGEVFAVRRTEGVWALVLCHVTPEKARYVDSLC